MAHNRGEASGVAAECSAKAMDLLARRPHFRRQLADKLGARGFELAVVDRVLDDFERRGYLDDYACALSLAEGTLRRKRFGPRRVRVELAKRGASQEIVDQVVEAAFEDGEEELIRESVSIWLRSRGWKRDALVRHLERKGFSGAAIWNVVEESAPEGAEGDLA